MQGIDQKILRLKRRLMKLGALHPGSLSRQYHVCGKPGCKCIDPHRPRPHGPYTKLTYVFHGKFRCLFVRADCLREVSALVAAFKTLRKLTDEWIGLGIDRAALGPWQRAAKNTARRQARKGRQR